MDGTHPAVEARRRRSNLQFSRFMPGKTSGIHTLKVGEEYITDRASIDSALGEYWAKIFSPPVPPVDVERARESWT
eukprot:11184519-Lingulodinium_polyedra.AAC.1